MSIRYFTMKQPLWICLITLTSLALAAPNVRQRTRIREPRTLLKNDGGYGIFGGQQTNINKYPYTVSVTYEPQHFLLGGGAMLTKKWVVCSAYEIQDYKSYADKLSVRAGSNKAESGGQKVNVSKIIIHENFKGDYPYDIALIKTAEEIEFGKNAKPIRLAKSKPKTGTKAQITGYGDTLVTTGDLLVATVQVKSSTECSAQHGDLGTTCQCADGKGVGPCYSDLGDPLVHNRQLLGYYLGGDMCNYYDLVEIYSNIAALRQWVIATINKYSDEDEIEGIDDEEFYSAYHYDTDNEENGNDAAEKVNDEKVVDIYN